MSLQTEIRWNPPTASAGYESPSQKGSAGNRGRVPRSGAGEINTPGIRVGPAGPDRRWHADRGDPGKQRRAGPDPPLLVLQLHSLRHSAPCPRPFRSCPPARLLLPARGPAPSPSSPLHPLPHPPPPPPTPHPPTPHPSAPHPSPTYYPLITPRHPRGMTRETGAG